MLALSISDMMTPALIGGVVIVFIIAFVITGFLKGLARMALGLIFLAAGMAAGQWGLWKGSSIAGTFVDKPDPWMSGVVAVILGLATFFVARALFGVILNPVSSREGQSKSLGAPGGILGLLMGAAFAWFCLSGVRYVGTISELVWIREAVSNKAWLNASSAENKSATSSPGSNVSWMPTRSASGMGNTTTFSTAGPTPASPSFPFSLRVNRHGRGPD